MSMFPWTEIGDQPNASFFPIMNNDLVAPFAPDLLTIIQCLPQEQRLSAFLSMQPFFVSPAWSEAVNQVETTSPDEAIRGTMSPKSRADLQVVEKKMTNSHKKPTRRKRSTPPATLSDDDDEVLWRCDLQRADNKHSINDSSIMVDINNLFSPQNYLNWTMLNKFYTKPQMSTPDDPVIHSPPSLGGQLMSGAYAGSIPKLEEGIGVGCASPDGGSLDVNGDGDARRRQKTCRVCGDHATGYNFNVITCESCKAFFRRNALRPKEFKCPYSEDCEINAVSRRFCQKCRLRKCFSVGMKKEWILNEEQLRRRKNSRLNNMANQQRQKHQQFQEMTRQQQVLKMNSPLSISPMEAQLGALAGRAVPPLVSPPTQGYSLMSPAGSAASSDSPPSRPLGLLPGGQRSPDAYDPNMLMQQRLRQEMAAAQRSPTAPVAVDPARKQVVLSMDAYQNLMQLAVSKAQDDAEPPAKRGVYSPGDIAAPQPRAFPSPLMPSVTSAFGMPTYMDISSEIKQQAQFPPGYAEKMERMSIYFDKTIEDALKIDSPEGPGQMGSSGMDTGSSVAQSRSDSRVNYQLNAAELRALDMVSEAFKGMNDQIESGSRQKASFLKNDKTPADIMNIMDVAMRRLVKVAKKLPAFNDLSQDGKFALLKAGMVEMLTVRGVARFDPRHGVWRSPTLPEPAEVSFDMFDKLNKEFRGEQKNRVMQFFKIFNDEIRNNELIIDLIILVVLFSPRDVIGDDNDKKLIARNHDQYSSLLQRYLESIYGDDAHRIYEQVPHALRMLREISTNSGMLFFGTVNSSEAEALPREIFKVE